MHSEALDFIQRSTKDLKPRNVVEIGSLYTEFARPSANSPLRAMLATAERYYGIDVYPGPTVDEVADGATWRPDGWQPDLVLCCEVLEHVPPHVQEAIVQNAYEMLAPGGTLLITAATDPRLPHTWDGHLQGTPGIDYWNVEPGLFAEVLDESPPAVEIDHLRGDIYVYARAPVVAFA